MITSKINFKNFRLKKKNVFIGKYLIKIIKNPNAVINSLKKFRNYQNLRIIGMGGSVLGFKAIHSFLFEKIKKILCIMMILKVFPNQIQIKII